MFRVTLLPEDEYGRGVRSGRVRLPLLRYCACGSWDFPCPCHHHLPCGTAHGSTSLPSKTVSGISLGKSGWRL